MTLDILTLFPEMFAGPFEYSIVKRASENGLVKINLHDLRQWATDKYKSVDDRPYGGGAGMVMRVDIIDAAVAALKSQFSKVVLMDAGGERYTQKKAEELARVEQLIIICGHYEGVDHRVHEHIAEAVISVGDYVLSGGEIPAMIIADSVIRLLPEVLGNPKSLEEESFHESLMLNDQCSIRTEYPQYTRPEEYKGWRVPEVLLSGNHKQIQEWRKSK